MKIAVLGTGIVGRTIAGKLAELGHEVVVGTRDPVATLARTDADAMGNPPFKTWSDAHPDVALATLADAAARGRAGRQRHERRRLDPRPRGRRRGQPGRQGADRHLQSTRLLAGHAAVALRLQHGLAGRAIQRRFPEARVVKTLNTVNTSLMVEPGQLAGGDHTVFVSGNDADAKATVASLLEAIGWTDIVDLGDITTARGTEMYLALWLRMLGALGTPMFSIKVVR